MVLSRRIRMNHNLTIEAGNWPDISLLETLTTEARSALAKLLDAGEAADLRLAPVTLLFTDNAAQKKLNAKWRGKDKAAMFSLSQRPICLSEGEILPIGDISFAFETIHTEAMHENKTFNAHLTHLIIHGFLHLLGYDHEEDKEAEQMEALEVNALKMLNIANPMNNSNYH